VGAGAETGQVRILPGTPSPKTCRSLSHFDRILSNRVGITDRPLGKLGKSREAAQVYRKIGATDATFYLDGIRIGAFREQGHHNDFDIELLALEGFNKAKAASYAEAARIGDLYNLSAGFADPEKSSIRNEIFEYTRRVVNVEWPAQAEGRMVDQDSIYLNRLNKMTFALHPSGQADGG